MKHFVYETVNIITGKLYRGVHSTNNVNDGYIGCGIRNESSAKREFLIKKNSPFVKAVNKHGYVNFKRTILEYFDSQSEAFEAEKNTYVNHDWVRRNDTYNAKIGGLGGDTFSLQSDENKSRLRLIRSKVSSENKDIIKNRFGNISKSEHDNLIEKSFQARKNGGFQCGRFTRSRETIIKTARSKSKFLIIDDNGRVFESSIEAAEANNISSDAAYTRSTRGIKGWTRKLKPIKE